MDENKKNIKLTDDSELKENVAAEAPSEQTETWVLKDGSFDGMSEKLDECGELTEAESVKSSGAAKKKSPPVQFPIIVSFAVLLCLFLAFITAKCFFNTSIVGTWTVDTGASTADEADSDGTSLAYYTFKDDGTLTISQGTMKIVSDYEVYEEDGTAYMYSSAFYTEYAYAVTGNIFTGRKLILSDSSASVALVSTSVKVPKIEVDEDFEPNELLTGLWNIPDYYVTYEFKDDGTFSFNQSDIYYYDGAYNYDGEALTLSYYTSELQTVSIEYYFDGDNTLVINGLGYSRMNADGTLVSTSDEA